MYLLSWFGTPFGPVFSINNRLEAITSCSTILLTYDHMQITYDGVYLIVLENIIYFCWKLWNTIWWYFNLNTKSNKYTAQSFTQSFWTRRICTKFDSLLFCPIFNSVSDYKIKIITDNWFKGSFWNQLFIWR